MKTSSKPAPTKAEPSKTAAPRPNTRATAQKTGAHTKALLDATRTLSKTLTKMRFAAPVAYVYNPLEYASAMVEAYIERHAHLGTRYLLLGMNPGPFGMAQTGIPFGEVNIVKDWLKIDAPVGKPAREHPKRPIVGLACTKSEVSGKRLWGAIRAKYPEPKSFFERAFVANYCPLLFVDEGGRNLTPDKLPKSERLPLEAACDAHLQALVAALQPKCVIGVGQYAANRAEKALPEGTKIAVLPHPSPASPAANRGWEALAVNALGQAGIRDLL